MLTPRLYYKYITAYNVCTAPYVLWLLCECVKYFIRSSRATDISAIYVQYTYILIFCDQLIPYNIIDKIKLINNGNII